MKKHGEDHTSTKWNGPGESVPGVEMQAKNAEERDRLVQLSLAALAESSAGHFFTWEDVQFLRDNWDGPLILKGIQSVSDAERAIEAKVDGIIVSNHGGRQVSGAIPSLRALDNITSSKKIQESNLTILFDSGIRTGSDIIKALARTFKTVVTFRSLLRADVVFPHCNLRRRPAAVGADAVLVGRPYMYGLALGGQEGVEHVLRGLLADLEITMALSGRGSVEELTRDILVRSEPKEAARARM